MKKLLLTGLAVGILATPLTSEAVPINANFSDYPGISGGQTDLDTVSANQWFYDNYGITFSNTYLYYDSRDTFDGYGVANDTDTGWIYFADTTDFVTVDWITISSNDIYIDVFDASNTLLDSYFYPGSGTTEVSDITLTGTGIASMSFHDSGGQVGISTLRYDFDGTTDGHNDDTNAPVPEPATMLLFGTGLLGLVGYSRKRAQKS